MKRAALCILIIVAALFVFTACDTTDDVTFYQESVEGKYGDGITTVGFVTPAQPPAEYTDLQRVEKKIFFDTRLTGYHYCGVYVVKGEEITITVPEDKKDAGLYAVVARYSSSAFTVKIEDTVTKFVSPVSGTLDIFLGNCLGDDFWQATVSGGIAGTYFRLGIDKQADWEKETDYAVLDGANVRIYAPAQSFINSDDLVCAATWWRSFVEYIDRLTVGNFGEDKTCPTDIFIGQEYSSVSYDAQKDIIYLPYDKAGDVCSYSSLTKGRLWDVMIAVVREKTEACGKFDKATLDGGVADILCAAAYIQLTNSIAKQEDSPVYWINNPYECLRGSLSSDWDAYGDLSLFVNLMHSFGTQKITDAFTVFDAQREISPKQRIYEYMLTQGVNIFDYLSEVYGFVPEIKHVGDCVPYVALQSKYALGAQPASNATGVIVNSGEKCTFDFANDVVTTAKSFTFDDSSLISSGWTKNQDGTYSFMPSDSHKNSEFVLNFTADGQSISLEGRLTYNIAVSVFSRYENVPYRDMKTAVKDYAEHGEAYLTQTSARSTASIPQASEEDDKIYTFSVNNGVIQVPETAKYRIYIKSKGITRVDFGVPEYMFTMFENTLTVNDYTEELFYEIDLEKGVSYYYDIYILATKGNSYATLGIQKVGEDVIRDIDENYLIYGDFDRDDIYRYGVAEYVPYTFNVNPEGRKAIENNGNRQVVKAPEAQQGSDIGAITDNNNSSAFVSAPVEQHEYVINLGDSLRMEYLSFYLGETQGVDFALSLSSDGENFEKVAEGHASDFTDVSFEKARRARFIRLQLSKEDGTAFSSTVYGFECGVYTKEATIVPSNSSKVLYQGKWQYKTGGISVNGWILESYGNDAAIEFNFYGTSVSVYCAKGAEYGAMQIYVDGKLNSATDLYSEQTKYNENVFSIEFQQPGKHTVRIVPASNDDVINLDYFTVVYAKQDEVPPEVGNLWYFSIIPAFLIVVFIVCLCLDIADKRNKKKKKVFAKHTDGMQENMPEEENADKHSDDKE